MSGGKVTAPVTNRFALVVALIAACLTVGLTWNSVRRAEAPPRGAETDLVEIAYRVDPKEWPSSRAPTLCEILNRHHLGEKARAATLWINRGKEACADRNSPVDREGMIRLAVWAPTNFDQCVKEAASCDAQMAEAARAP